MRMIEKEVKVGHSADELSTGASEAICEQPTLADLVLPGSGYSFSDEFALS